MDKDLFLQWLLEKHNLAAKVAHDVVSRCKRVESILGHRLETATTSQGAFNASLTKLRQAQPLRNDLLYAMRLYAAFKNPSLDTNKYAFYGNKKRGELRGPRTAKL